MQFTLPQVCQPLRVWDRIEIVVGEGHSAGRYVARIEDFLKEGIAISSPDFINGGELLRENSHVSVLLTREDAVYRFHSRIKRVSTHLKTIYVLTFPEGAERIQRRQFVRVELYSRVSYANLTSSKKPQRGGHQLTWLKSTTLNISGGGMLLKADENLAPKDLLLVKIDFFPETGLPNTIAAICRRTFRRENNYFAGIEFLSSEKLEGYFNKQEMAVLPRSVRDFDRNVQNKLAAHIFRQQVELRKKGLL